MMQVDTATLVSNDWPSFEFAMKAALDADEFCIKVRTIQIPLFMWYLRSGQESTLLMSLLELTDHKS